MNIRRKLLICLFGIVLPLLSLFGQRTEKRQFSCTSNCGFDVKITPNPAVICEGQQLKLVAEITGSATGLTYNWSSPSIETVANNELVVDKTATYSVTVADASGCEVIATNQVQPSEETNLDKLFAKNCFISIPVTYEGGSGLQNSGTARTEDLVVKIKGTANTINVSEIFNQGSIAGLSHFYSDNCADLQIARTEFEGGNAAWAHVDGVGENAMLYIGASPSSTNDAGQAIVNAYHLFWDAVYPDNILSAPINYLCGGEQFLASSIGEGWLITLRKIVTCLSSDPKKGGFVPKCLWECASILPGERDLPFAAGLLDGAYQIITDVVDLGKLIVEIADLSRALLLYPFCHSIEINEDFFQKLENKTNDKDFFDQIKIGINQLIDITTGADCEDATKKLKEVNKKVDKTIDFFSDWENLVMVYDAISMQFFKYLDEIKDCSDFKKCNNAKYEQAKLIFNFASLFYGGGELKAFNKFASTFWIGLMNKLPADQAKVLAKLLEDRNFTDKVDELIKAGESEALDAMKEILSPRAWRNIVEDPEILDAWKKLRIKPCPIGRNLSNNKCEELLNEVFSNPNKKLIKTFGKDGADDDFYKKMIEKREFFEPYEALSVLSDRKAWVRTNTDLLQRMLDKPSYDRTVIANFFKGSIKRACKPLPCDFDTPGGTVEISNLGFPDLRPYSLGGKKYYYTENVQGNRTSDFTNAKNWLKMQEGVVKIEGSGGRVRVELEDGTRTEVTWHHHEDGSTLMPVFSEVHDPITHAGGVSIVKKEMVEFFDSP